MQVINLKLESNMKEEMLEAIYGTVERLEQKSMNFLLHQRTQERKLFSALQVLTQANLKKPSFPYLQKKRKLLAIWQN